MIDELNADMSSGSTEAFFREADPLLAGAIHSMESVETWTRDQVAEVQATLQKIAERVEELDPQMPQSLHNQLIVLLGYISTGKALKLLMWFDANNPNFVARTLAEAQLLSVLDRGNAAAAGLLVERFEVLERNHLLARIFSEDRLLIVQKVLRILKGDDPDVEPSDEQEEEPYAQAS
ncbi:type IVB secretion system protein IcmW [Variovorax sp. LT1P1]|uniref:type IVB secretion system protein IcmW n=1 Tax=Variovorax sp. LT1P1 TaxID=3443730 RepID=UPI003F48C5EB